MVGGPSRDSGGAEGPVGLIQPDVNLTRLRRSEKKRLSHGTVGDLICLDIFLTPSMLPVKRALSSTGASTVRTPYPSIAAGAVKIALSRALCHGCCH